MAEDKTLRLILGIILVLLALPGFLAIAFMPRMMGYNGYGMIGYGMMGSYGFGYGFASFVFIATLAILVLGIYLITKNLK